MTLLQIPQTGQATCYDPKGNEIPCKGSGQDGEHRAGLKWPSPRFVIQGNTVQDLLTGLVWARNANPNEFPVTWQEAFDQIMLWNEEAFLGYNDWRLPNRRELRSLMSYQTRKPSLPAAHPFFNVFLNWYWTSTSAAINPAYAWYVHLEGARMFYGRKDQYYLVWPVRQNSNQLVLRTGQNTCYDRFGNHTSCKGSGQDGETRSGAAWPETRFEVKGEIVHDGLTGLYWSLRAGLSNKEVSWQQALDTINSLNAKSWCGVTTWRLPNINELESLVDCSCHSPALSPDHPFKNLREEYWSSTTSYFGTDWAWVLYLKKGACGVGYKQNKTFFVWPVYG